MSAQRDPELAEPNDLTPEAIDAEMAKPIAPWPPLPIWPGQTWRLD